MAASAEAAPTSGPLQNHKKANRAPARFATWIVALAALTLTGISVGGYVYQRSRLAAMSAKHLRLMVTGPTALQTGTPANYMIGVTAIDGRPLQTQVEIALLGPDGTRLTEHRETTDERGQLRVTIPADPPLPAQVTLRVVASQPQSREQAEIPLTVEPVRYRAGLATDRPLYQPVDTVYYRSRLQTRLGAPADASLPIAFEILDPKGAAVSGSRRESVTTRGVGCGAFALPASSPPGRYTLLVRSLNQTFPDQTRPFEVRSYQLPRWQKSLEFARGSYVPGEEVTAVFRAKQNDSTPAAGAKLHVIAIVDGRVIFEQTAAADPSGALAIEFPLPEKIDRNEGQLVTTIADDGVEETQNKTIPILLGAIDVDFFPEGGALTAGLENRVYFAARDSLGRPVSLSGAIVAVDRKEKETDGKKEPANEKDRRETPARENEVAAFETTCDGLGVITLAPLPWQDYRLKVNQPAGVKCDAKLPDAAADREVVMNTGPGVFDAGAPLSFQLRATKPSMSLVAAVYRHDVQVGEQPLVTTTDPTADNPVTIALADSIAGVLRLAVYDFGVSPPRLAAERIVYRRPSQNLNVQIADSKGRHMPGEPVELALSVTNEKGEPAAALLGVSVVDEALLHVADTATPNTLASIAPTGEIRSAGDLDGVAESWLSDNAKSDVPAAVALDLLLGVQPSRFAAKAESKSSAETKDTRGDLTVGATGAGGPPALADNLNQIREEYDQSLAEYRAGRTGNIDVLIIIAFLGSLGLTLFVAMLSLMRVAWAVHLWVLALGAAVCCLVVASLMDRGRSSPGPDALTAFQSCPVLAPEERKQPATQAEQPSTQKSVTGGSKETAPNRADTQEMPPTTPEPTYVYQRNSDQPGGPRDITETLFWNPTLTTGPDGKASIRFHLPSTVTTFRVSVDAQGGGRFGAGQAVVVSAASADADSKPSPDAAETSDKIESNLQPPTSTP